MLNRGGAGGPLDTPGDIAPPEQWDVPPGGLGILCFQKVQFSTLELYNVPLPPRKKVFEFNSVINSHSKPLPDEGPDRATE